MGQRTQEETGRPRSGLKRKISRARGRHVRVTLDQDTAHPALTLSADWLNVRLGDTQQDLPDNPERFNERPCVLGSQGFTKGAVYWEVEVGNEVFWVVGVARESVRRKGWVSASRKEGIWAIDWSRRMPPVPPSPQSTPPQKSRQIRVCLNYEGRQVTFFSADNEALILTVTGANFARERIRPFFGTKSQLRLCPCPEPEGQAGDPHQ
ncbi:butyrophilin subfamily 1 member A1-like [Eretmochelys imbricata]